MGMDVFGKDARSKTGEYFRRNVWGWRPLADMVTELFPAETAGCQYWHSNDGDGLDAAESETLAAAIEAAIADGRIAAYIKERDERIAALPMQQCQTCGGKGTRLWADGEKPCNSCHGEKKVKAWDTWYHLDLDDAKEFAAFLKDCGGFKIC